METQRPPPLPRKFKRPRFLWLLVGGLLVLFLAPPLVGLIWYVNARISNTSAIHRLEDEVRQRGEPLTLAELQAKYPPIPEAENAAIPLMALWEKEDPSFWRAFQNDLRPLPSMAKENYDVALPIFGADAAKLPRRAPLNAESLAAAERYLQTKSSHLQEVHAALLHRRFRFPFRLTDGLNAPVPHLSLLKTEGQRFRLQALVASQRSETDTAIGALSEASQTGQLLADEPVFISQLVRIACLRITIDGAEQLLSQQTLTDAQLERLKSVFDQSQTKGALRLALTGDRAFALSVFDPNAPASASLTDSSDPNADPEETARGNRIALRGMRAVGLAGADQRFMLETFKEAITLASEETPESLKQLEELFERVTAEVRKVPPKIFSGMFLPALSRAASRFAAGEAHRRAGLTAVALERYRLQHDGHVPEKLEDLVPVCLPGIPLDPFDGQPLRYRKLEKGYVVYSIGSDRKDNGGKERPLRGSAKEWDETFTVER